MREHDNDTGLISKNILVDGRRTSVRLEPEMWIALKDISTREKCSIHELCTLVNMCKRPASTLTAGIRVFLMLYYRAATTEEGHLHAGHGDIMRMRSRADRKGVANTNRQMSPAMQDAMTQMSDHAQESYNVA